MTLSYAAVTAGGIPLGPRTNDLGIALRYVQAGLERGYTSYLKYGNVVVRFVEGDTTNGILHFAPVWPDNATGDQQDFISLVDRTLRDRGWHQEAT